MKKRIVLIISLVALASLLVIGGTMAWFTNIPDPVFNKFTAGSVKVEVNEHDFQDIENWNPGDVTDKEVSVISNGSKATYVRVALTPTWSNDESVDNVKLYLNTQDWLFFDEDQDGLPDDGYYYYKDILNQGDETNNLLTKVELIGDATGNDYQDATLTIKVDAQAVQASNDAYKDVWDLEVLPTGVEQFGTAH
ncbi:MAG: TasA family protein [Clostridia bacterium]|nr:TasA family protein [Clostridia bacterium]